MNDGYVDVPEMMKLYGIVRRKTMQDSYIAPTLTDQITKNTTIILVYMGKIKGFVFAVRHREILMTDLGLFHTTSLSKN